MTHESTPQSDPRQPLSPLSSADITSSSPENSSLSVATFVTGSSVTPGYRISGPGEKTPLLCGVDTLDLGIQSHWPDAVWGVLSERLAQGKLAARNTDGIRFSEESLILPSGSQGYLYHLKYTDLDLYIANRQFPHAETPNVYASPSSCLIWERGVMAAAGFVVQKVEELGGIVQSIKPSRVDLCADFEVPGGLDLGMLLTLRVPVDLEHRTHGKGTELQSFYHGNGQTPILVRIYSKSVEVLKKQEKLWFFDLWNVTQQTEVWRFEFQIRREVLKQFGIETVEDLLSKQAGIWTYLTTKTFSLRLLDNPNTSRRTIHPLWKAVQKCSSRFGEVRDVSRVRFHQLPDPEWYVRHIAGCLTGYAVRQGIGSLERALELLSSDLRELFQSKDFYEEVCRKSIAEGILPPALSGPSKESNHD